MSKNYLLLLILKLFSIDYNHENGLSSNTFNACNCFKGDNNKIYLKKKSLYSLHLRSGEISVLTSAGFYLFTKTLQLSRLYLAARFRGSLSVIHSEVFPYQPETKTRGKSLILITHTLGLFKCSYQTPKPRELASKLFCSEAYYTSGPVKFGDLSAASGSKNN